MARPDHLDSVLHIEEQSFQAGFAEGHRDGVHGGKIEGRTLGLKKGFEKFLESGRLAGRAVVWGNRQGGAAASRSPNREFAGSAPGPDFEPPGGDQIAKAGEAQGRQLRCTLPALSGGGNARLRKNIESVYALVEPGTLSSENTDEAVGDFDDRLKRALGKAKVVERMLGESGGGESAAFRADRGIQRPEKGREGRGDEGRERG